MQLRVGIFSACALTARAEIERPRMKGEGWRLECDGNFCSRQQTLYRGYSGHRRRECWREIEVEVGGIKREIRDAKEPDVLGVACREQVLRKGSKRAGGEKFTT